MNVSVDTLKEMLAAFERDVEGEEYCVRTDDIVESIRELISIKEAEPVGFLFIIEDDYVMADGAIERVDFNYVTNEDDAKISGNEALKGRHMLIRKPE